MLRVTFFSLQVSCLLATAIHADTLPVFTPIGARVGPSSVPVSAVATFVTAADSLSITLTNLLEDPFTVNQNLTGLGFVFSTGETAAELTGSSARERTISLDRTYIDGDTVPTGWDIEPFSFPFGGGLRLHLLGTATSPAHSLIGGPDPDTDTYLAANRSVRGNGPHNAFLSGPATFTLHVPGVTAETTVTGVGFWFNTSEGSFTDTVITPEPASLLLLPVGLALLGIGRKLWM